MADSLNMLTIRGFRSIQKLESFELRNLNVLIGGNGAGKSNLIDFFRLLRSIIDGNLNDFICSGGGISDFLYNGRKITSQMEFETIFGVRGYRFTLKPGLNENCILTDEARYDENSRFGWWELNDWIENNQSRLVKEAKSNTNDSQYSSPVYESISSWHVYHFHDTTATAPMRHYEIIQDNKALRYNASNIAPYLLKIKNEYPHNYQEIISTLRTVMPFFDDFILEERYFGDTCKVNISWKQHGSDYPMQPYHLSDGSVRFICLATVLLQPKLPSTIIIDEPELGLHPYAINILAELMQNASKFTQLIVATQSPTLLDNFSIDDIIVVNRKDGASIFERLQESELKNWLEEYSIGELWRKNVIAGGPDYEQ